MVITFSGCQQGVLCFWYFVMFVSVPYASLWLPDHLLSTCKSCSLLGTLPPSKYSHMGVDRGHELLNGGFSHLLCCAWEPLPAVVLVLHLKCRESLAINGSLMVLGRCLEALKCNQAAAPGAPQRVIPFR
eukprot:scaffold216279_cov20-Tisochrysis_lutea.AAC.2